MSATNKISRINIFTFLNTIVKGSHHLFLHIFLNFRFKKKCKAFWEIFLNVTCEVDFVKTMRDFMEMRVVGKPLLLVR